MSEIKYNEFDTPVVKSIKDIEKGDVLRFEYGDFDNYVRVVFDHYEDDESGMYKLVGNYPSDGSDHESYGLSLEGKYSVIGHIIE